MRYSLRDLTNASAPGYPPCSSFRMPDIHLRRRPSIRRLRCCCTSCCRGCGRRDERCSSSRRSVRPHLPPSLLTLPVRLPLQSVRSHQRASVHTAERHSTIHSSTTQTFKRFPSDDADARLARGLLPPCLLPFRAPRRLRRWLQAPGGRPAHPSSTTNSAPGNSTARARAARNRAASLTSIHIVFHTAINPRFTPAPHPAGFDRPVPKLRQRIRLNVPALDTP